MNSLKEIDPEKRAALIRRDLLSLDTDMSEHGALRHSTAWSGGAYTWTVEAWRNLLSRSELAERIVGQLEDLVPEQEGNTNPLINDMIALREALRGYLSQAGKFGTPTPFGTLEGPRIVDDTQPLNPARGAISRLLTMGEE